jgi:hypothetical protein
MSWLDKKVSLYNTHSDNTGKVTTIRDILLCDFVRDLSTIIELKSLDRSQPGYEQRKRELKNTLQCFTPAALLRSKAKGQVEVIEPTGLMQLDFDYDSIKDYCIDELKAAVFDLPFIAFCGGSCSGGGFYALAVIQEPEKLFDYAMHCFDVLDRYGVHPDRSKGRKPENLRYVSYDATMLIKDNPKPLHIKHFKPKAAPKPINYTNPLPKAVTGNRQALRAIEAIRTAPIGNRFPTVQKWAYTLGGYNDRSLLEQITDVIKCSSQYTGMEDKYLKCAVDQFSAGQSKPFNNGR